jgi:hypothetical protein
MQKATETTIWENAIYCTDDKEGAEWYARLRVHERQSWEATVYWLHVQDAKLIDFTRDNIEALSKKITIFYTNWLRKIELMTQEEIDETMKIFWIKISKNGWIHGLKTRIPEIEKLHSWNIKTIAQGAIWAIFTLFVTDYMNCDGVIVIEWGDDEQYTKKDIKSYVIFNPNIIKRIEQKKKEM